MISQLNLIKTRYIKYQGRSPDSESLGRFSFKRIYDLHIEGGRLHHPHQRNVNFGYVTFHITKFTLKSCIFYYFRSSLIPSQFLIQFKNIYDFTTQPD